MILKKYNNIKKQQYTKIGKKMLQNSPMKGVTGVKNFCISSVTIRAMRQEGYLKVSGLLIEGM